MVVGVPKEATPSTPKDALRELVSFVDPPTSTAGLGCVGRIELNERHPGGMGPIYQEATELGKRPRMHHEPLGLAKPYPVADAAQLLDGDAASSPSASWSVHNLRH